MATAFCSCRITFGDSAPECANPIWGCTVASASSWDLISPSMICLSAGAQQTGARSTCPCCAAHSPAAERSRWWVGPSGTPTHVGALRLPPPCRDGGGCGVTFSGARRSAFRGSRHSAWSPGQRPLSPPEATPLLSRSWWHPPGLPRGAAGTRAPQQQRAPALRFGLDRLCHRLLVSAA